MSPARAEMRSRELSSGPRTRRAKRGRRGSRPPPLGATAGSRGVFQRGRGRVPEFGSRLGAEGLLEARQAYLEVFLPRGPSDPKAARSTKKRSGCDEDPMGSGGLLDEKGEVSTACD